MVAASRSMPGASILQLPPTQCPLVFPQTGTEHWWSFPSFSHYLFSFGKDSGTFPNPGLLVNDVCCQGRFSLQAYSSWLWVWGVLCDSHGFAFQKQLQIICKQMSLAIPNTAIFTKKIWHVNWGSLNYATCLEISLIYAACLAPVVFRLEFFLWAWSFSPALDLISRWIRRFSVGHSYW